MENHHFQLGNTSSNDNFPLVLYVSFRGVIHAFSWFELHPLASHVTIFGPRGLKNLHDPLVVAGKGCQIPAGEN